MKQTIYSLASFFFVCLFLLLIPKDTSALMVRSGDNVTISGTRVINETVIVAGKRVMVNAPIDGDLICAGQTVEVNAAVNGDIICAARTLRLNGQVVGSVRAAAQEITLTGTTRRQAYLAAGSITVDEKAVVGREMVFGTETMQLLGRVGAHVTGGAEYMFIDGTIGGNVHLQTNELEISDQARVAGDVNYTSKNKADIAQGVVSGNVTRNEPKVEDSRRDRAEQKPWFNLGAVVMGILAGVVLVGLFTLLFAKSIKQVLKHMSDQPVKYGFVGFLLLIGVPIVALILAFTFIGFPVAFMLFLVWLIALLISHTFVAFYVGSFFMNAIAPKNKSLFWTGVVGVILTQLAYNLPYLGWFLAFLGLCLGIGSLFYTFRRSF